MSEDVPVARKKDRRAIFARCLRDPLFVPPEGWKSLTILGHYGVSEFVGELERLAALGAPWAAGARALISLYPDPNGKRDIERAINLCEPFNQDGYCLYVLACARLLRGDTAAGMEEMNRAMMRGFSPAYLEMMRFGWNSWRDKQGDPKVALGMLKYAARAGHRGALMTFCVLARTGWAGIALKIMGQALLPIGFVYYSLGIRRDPFSSNVLMFNRMSREPIFK